MRTTAAGRRALLVDCATPEEALAAAAHFDAHPLRGQRDVIGGMQSVLLLFHDTQAAGAARSALEMTGPPDAVVADGTDVHIDVVYDGSDLGAIADVLGASPDGVVAWHGSRPWRVAFAGFAPGFHYLLGDEASPVIPRRRSPRTAVPAGSVAVADRFSGVYPAESPGGWQLLGTTETRVWDLSRPDPAVFHSGDRVWFHPVRAKSRAAVPAPSGPGRGPDDRTATALVSAGGAATGLRILAPGVSALVQDAGRPGRGGLGVPESGALDRGSFDRANDLVGNARGAAALELLFGGARVEARGELVVAATGAECDLVVTSPTRPERREEPGRPFALRSEERLFVGHPRRGVRTYVAVRGGLQVGQELGSASTDLLSGLGAPPLEGGMFLPIGTVARSVGREDIRAQRLPDAGTVTVRIVLGPRAQWFTADSIERLLMQEWQVTAASNRVGLRLAGEHPLERSGTRELPSEGVVTGSLQVPASGQPILFLADHPVTGGYPVIAVVDDRDLDLAAQVGPGNDLRFVVAEEHTDRKGSPCSMS